MYRKSTSILNFEQCNQSLSNLSELWQKYWIIAGCREPATCSNILYVAAQSMQELAPEMRNSAFPH